MLKTYIQLIDGKWYAYAASQEQHQVCSIGSDNPPSETGCSKYVAKWTDKGVKYVASPSPSRDAAYRKAKRCGTYCGEIK